jgi:hypothetical protein
MAACEPPVRGRSNAAHASAWLAIHPGRRGFWMVAVMGENGRLRTTGSRPFERRARKRVAGNPSRETRFLDGGP